MQVPLQITFRDFPPSEAMPLCVAVSFRAASSAIAARVRQQAEKLNRFSNRISKCQVVLEVPHQHHRHGNIYRVRINLTLPGEELVIDRSSQNQSHKNLYIAMRDAFNAAQRKLKNYADAHKW